MIGKLLVIAALMLAVLTFFGVTPLGSPTEQLSVAVGATALAALI